MTYKRWQGPTRATATPLGTSSSAGIASSDGTHTADALLALADAALYDAKRHGQAVSVA
jgi:GGDEF domain-containing protein